MVAAAIAHASGLRVTVYPQLIAGKAIVLIEAKGCERQIVPDSRRR